MSGRKRHLAVDTQGLLLRVVVHPADVQDERAARYAGLTVEIVTRPPGGRGFAVQPRRWVVERTFGWLGRSRALSKDYEAEPASSEAWIYLAMTHLMLRRLHPR